MRKPKRNSPTEEAIASQLARLNWSLRPALRKRAGRRKSDPNPGRNSKKDNKTSNTGEVSHGVQHGRMLALA